MYTEIQKKAAVVVVVIPHDQQRYPTVGDYWWDKESEVWQMRISEMPDWRWEKLVEEHERVELLLCLQRGVLMEDIDRFDLQFEEEIKQGTRQADSEPGDDSAAPYYHEHLIATEVERLMARELGVDWEEYDGYLRRM